MNYLMSDRNALVWFCFTVYVITAVLILPNTIEFKSGELDISSQQSLQFAARFVLRISLILPMVFLLKNSI